MMPERWFFRQMESGFHPDATWSQRKPLLHCPLSADESEVSQNGEIGPRG